MTDLETTERRLSELANRVRSNLETGRDRVLESIHCQLAVGQALLEARELLKSNQRYGEWFQHQKFGFSVQWAGVLRRAAAHKQGVLAACETQVSDGDMPNLREALKIAEAAAPPKPAKKPVVLDEDSTEEDRTEAAAVFAPDPPPGDVGGNPIQQPQDEPEPGSVGTALDENENSGGGVSVREGGDSVAAADTPPPDVVDGGAVSSPAPVDKPGRDTAVHRARPGKPAHRIPLNEAGATLYRAITTLESLTADKHNGADVIDYWIDQTGAHLDDIERQLAAAAEFISHAQIVIGQRKRAA